MMFSFNTDPYIAEQQMKAIIFCLVAFSYIDEDFDPRERSFIQNYVAKLCDERAKLVLGDDGIPRADVVERWTKHYHEVVTEYDYTVKDYFSESVNDGETTEQFVLAKLKLGCFELLRHFDDAGQKAVLATVTELMHADGVVDSREQEFVDDLIALMAEPIALDDADVETLEDGAVIVEGAAKKRVGTRENHPFFNRFEWDFAEDVETFAQQAIVEKGLIESVHKVLDGMRSTGNGRLGTATSFTEFAGQAPFLDGHIHVVPSQPGREYDLLVLGDLHGCYSCLKAALLQADFFDKVQAYRENPDTAVIPYLVLLGDYIDRGKFSYSGTLRSVLQLLVSMPQHVFVLRGNHEYYIELNGKVVAPVRPCEAMDSIKEVATNDVFATYMKLFDALPNMLVFDQTMFVHGGIPRQSTIDEKYKNLASLNDGSIRFQMLWSDPSEADVIPAKLQEQNARFPFGRRQFQAFLAMIGCKAMVRGHERVKEGFRTVYDDPEGVLVSVFSCGGADNDDLPERSNYRQVTPKAVTITVKDGVTSLAPFDLDYAKYNQPEYNAFFRDEFAAMSTLLDSIAGSGDS